MRSVGVAAVAAFLITVPARAETISEYAATCKTQLGLAYISGYICGQGSTASGQGFLIGSANNRLGKVQMPNPNVEAIFLCRDYNVSSFTTNLNGYILQNTITGNTCFFDARTNAAAVVPDPSHSSAATVWKHPTEYLDECQTCHSADPFIVTPGLTDAMRAQNMMRRGRNTRGPYKIVNSDVSTSHFFNWNAERQLVTSSCASAQGCHNTSNTSFSTNMINTAVAQGWMQQAGYTTFSNEPAASIGVWRPGATGTFFLDANGNKSWDLNDQWGDFGTWNDVPVVVRGPDCRLPETQTTEFGLVRNGRWMVTRNNHFYDSADDAGFFVYRSGRPTSWNGVPVMFANSTFQIDYNASRTTGGDLFYPFGSTNSFDIPVIGRWKRGIGHRMGTFRVVNGSGFWYLDTGSNGWDASDTSAQFGADGDRPFVGDFNQDGIDEIGVFRNGTWFVDMNNNFVWNGTGGGDAQFFFGQAGDVPVVSPGKWNCAW